MGDNLIHGRLADTGDILFYIKCFMTWLCHILNGKMDETNNLSK